MLDQERASGCMICLLAVNAIFVGCMIYIFGLGLRLVLRLVLGFRVRVWQMRGVRAREP